MANSYGRECKVVQKVPAQALALFGSIPKGSKIGPFLGQFWTPFLGLNRPNGASMGAQNGVPK
jgi:hypothetical protein